MGWPGDDRTGPKEGLDNRDSGGNNWRAAYQQDRGAQPDNKRS